ncbi:MAG: hypothetical protein ACI9J2_001796 [Saprospiraceae bacterium]|jgi:hypothetical protein
MRRLASKFITTAFVVVTLLSHPVGATEISSEFAVEGQFFSNKEGGIARDSRLGLSLQPRITHRFKHSDSQFTLEPFLRWDSEDSNRSHADIRELNVLTAKGDWELLVGVGKEFWGVAESNHLVDVINQTDALEGIDGEDKLGQPMIRLSHIFEQSTLTAFVLPGFREREFLGPNSRFYLGLSVDKNATQFQSSNGDDHVDYALRLNGYLGQLDYGLSWFDGTSRQPTIRSNGAGGFAAYYPQMQQVSVEAQYTSETWLWKLEALNNSQINASYNAAVAGFEYSFYGLKEGLLDVGALLEIHIDSRDDASQVNLQNDLFLGTRLAFNDAESSELLVGGFLDLDDDSTSFRIEGARRIWNDAKLSIEAQVFGDIATDNIAYGFKDNDYLKLELQLFF